MKRFLLIVAAVFVSLPVFSQLTISNTLTPTQLVQNILLGTGVTVSNVTYTGAPISAGSFTCGGPCNLGLSGGVFLTTGTTNPPFNPASYHHSTNVNGPPDGDLNAIVAPLLTQDAAVLEFDFSVAADSVQFQYVFASEEYNDYVNTPFNDVFGFFISGPGITGTQNIALIPGTTTPVAINNVNNGGPYPGASAGPCNNCAYFVDNIGGGSVYFDAFTTVLTAKAAVYPCETYHIKLAIADVNDGIFDSGVFLAENSFSTLGQIAIFANGVAQQNNATVYACQGDSVQLCLNPSTSYSWSSLQTTQCIWVTEANLSPTGVYSGAVFNGTGCFAFTTNINIQFIQPSASITPGGPTDLCPGSTVTLTANTGQTYLWSNGATTQSITVGTAGAYTVTVGFGPNCAATSTPVNVTVGAASAQISGITSLCNGAATTLTANAGQSYQWNTGASSQSINVSTTGTYTVTVTQVGGCTATASVNVQLNPNPSPNITGLLTVCQGQNASLDAGGGYSGYLWSTGATTQTLNTANAGTYTVTVTDANGCTGTANAQVQVSSNPSPNITGTLDFCTGSSTTLNAGGGYNAYQWSTGATTQTLNVTAPGTYTATVTNAAGCTGTVSAIVNMNPLPSPNITGPTSVCQGNVAILNAGAGYNAYQWSTGATTQNLNVTASGTYTVTVTDAQGCSNTDITVVTVNPNPVASITGPAAICAGDVATLDGGTGFSTYLWSTGATTQTINSSAAGTYTVTVTNIFGCSDEATSVLTVNQLPVPSISGNNSICSGETTTLDAGAGYSNYSWSTGATTSTITVSNAGSYAVTVTDNNGCSGSSSVLLTVNSLPQPVISGTFTICDGDNSLFDAGAGYSGYLWSNGSSTQTISVSTAGSYTVTVTDINGCSGTTAAVLNVNSNPVPAISGIISICQGDLTTLDAGAGYQGYLWSTGATTQTLSTGAGGTVTVTVTDNNGCTGEASASVTVNQLPVPAITGNNSFCQGETSILDAGAGYQGYIWNTGATTSTITVSAAGAYTVTVTDNNGCTGSDIENITVNQNPAPSITGGPAICQGETEILDAGAGYSSYLWNNGATAQQISVSAAGQYTVTVTSASGCEGDATTTLTVNPLPSPAITGQTEICQGSSSTFDAGSGYSSYSWSNGQTTQTIIAGIAGAYTVTVTDANGCSNTDIINLTVNNLPVPQITGDLQFCDGSDSDLNAGPGYQSYQWSTGATGQILNVTQAGTYSVVVTDNNGCTGSASVQVTVNQLPVPQITGINAICDGSTTTFDAGTGYAAYQWSNGSTAQSIVTGAAGTYVVTVIDINGCIGSTSETLVVNDIPFAAISGTSSICEGEQATVTIDFSGTPPFQYTYLANQATIGPLVSSSNQVNIPVSPQVTTSYSMVSVSDQNCPGTVSGSSQVTVFQLPEPEITGNLSVCDGETTTLQATPGFSSYLWSNGSSATSITTSDGGIYTVTVTDLNGCAGVSPPVNFIVNQVPEVIFSNDTSLTCEVSYVNFHNLSNYPPGSSFSWDFGDGSVSSSTSPAHVYAQPGNYTVTLHIVTPAGCESQASQQVSVVYFPLPVADFITAPSTATLFDSKIEFVDRSQYAVSWHWEFGDGSFSDEQNSEHYYNDVGEFRVSLTVLNIAGCEDTHSELINILPFYIPNAFTPNGDGINDNFFSSGYVLDIASYRMKIFNRWGEEVFSATDINQTWSGNDRDGDPAPQGTYVYRMEVTTKGGKEHVFTGHVNLIR